MFDSAIVSVPGQKKKITVEEALSEKQFAKIYLCLLYTSKISEKENPSGMCEGL